MPLNGVSRDDVIDGRDIDLLTAAMLMGLLFRTRFHSAILMADDVPKGRDRKLWQIWGGWFASVLSGKWKMSNDTGWSREKSGASLFEKGKQEAVYQFQTVGKNATKFGQDCIEKPIGPTGICCHTLIFFHSD